MLQRRRLAWFALGCGTALAAACSGGSNLPSPKGLPPNPHTLAVERVWERNVGGGGGNQLLGLAAGAGSGEVVAAGVHGNVAAFAAKSGEQDWRSHVKKQRLSAGPAIGDGVVVVGTRSGDVVALDAATGAPKWTHFVGAPVIASPAIGSGVVVVKTIAGAVVGLAPATGKELWTVTESTPSLTLRFDTRPLVVDGVAYAGFADGKALAVDAGTGKQVWRKQVASGQGGNLVANMVDVGGLMGFAGGDLYVATYQGRLAALDSASGAILWSREVSSYTGVALDASHAYVSDAEGRVHAYDLVTGVPDWTYDKLGYRGLSAAVPIGPVVAVGDKFGWLHFIGRDDGHYLDRVRVSGSAIRMPPVVSGNLLIVLAGDGTLAAYRVAQPK